MSPRILLAPSLTLICLLATVVPSGAQCDPDGDVEFLCGPKSPEDMIAVPDSPWIVVSGMEDDGELYVADTRDHSSRSVFPTGAPAPRLDGATFTGCPGPIEGGFRPHGISLRPGDGGSHTLYVVRHGAREAIEVFNLTVAEGSAPALTWVGCVEAPEGVSLNSVTALPGAGFVVTNFRLAAGQLWEWDPVMGWAEVPGSETSGPNGVVASADGKWLFIGGWGTESLIRISRGSTPVQKDSVAVGFYVDNVRWAPDGSLLVAGHTGGSIAVIGACISSRSCDGVASRVARVDPEELTVEDLVSYPSNEHVILGTVAIEVGDEIWMGGIAGSDRIARFAASP